MNVQQVISLGLTCLCHGVGKVIHALVRRPDALFVEFAEVLVLANVDAFLFGQNCREVGVLGKGRPGIVQNRLVVVGYAERQTSKLLKLSAFTYAAHLSNTEQRADGGLLHLPGYCPS